MAANDKWVIAGVLPGDFEEYGDWVVQVETRVLDKIGSGIIYHRHTVYEMITNNLKNNITSKPSRPVLMMVNRDGYCRTCGALAPKGVLFRSKLAKLDEA